MSKPSRSRASLIGKLDDMRQFLELSCASFDAGFEAEALRLATTLRVLVHDTKHSASLLQQLKVKDRWDFLDDSDPIDPTNLGPTFGLFMIGATKERGTSYLPRLGPHDKAHRRAFPAWWGRPVIKVDGTWSRRELVLMLANKEGGSHVDPDLDERYEAITNRNAIGILTPVRDPANPTRFLSDPTNPRRTLARPLSGSIVAVSVRHIAFEMLETIASNATALGLTPSFTHRPEKPPGPSRSVTYEFRTDDKARIIPSSIRRKPNKRPT